MTSVLLAITLVENPWPLDLYKKIYENTTTIITSSRPIMRELAETTGESVALFSLDEQTSVCLAREFGSSRLVFSIIENAVNV